MHIFTYLNSRALFPHDAPLFHSPLSLILAHHSLSFSADSPLPPSPPLRPARFPHKLKIQNPRRLAEGQSAVRPGSAKGPQPLASTLSGDDAQQTALGSLSRVGWARRRLSTQGRVRTRIACRSVERER